MPQQNNMQTKLTRLRQHLVPLLQPTCALGLGLGLGLGQALGTGGLCTLNTVIERLGRQHDVNLQAPTANPLSDLLPQIKQANAMLPVHCQHMVNSVLALADDLPWYQRSVAGNPSFMAGHVNAQIIGPEGLETRHDLIVGVTLMRPDVDYPDHQHEPEEIYLVLSEGRWRQAKGNWHTPGPGGLVYNPSDVMHGMKSMGAPLFALWCLPLNKPFTSFNPAIAIPS
jgi:hypothetical protein